jgi:hypothetical protein
MHLAHEYESASPHIEISSRMEPPCEFDVISATVRRLQPRILRRDSAEELKGGWERIEKSLGSKGVSERRRLGIAAI